MEGIPHPVLELQRADVPVGGGLEEAVLGEDWGEGGRGALQKGLQG